MSVGRNQVIYPQVINNACATQAIISVLLNIQNPEIDIGTIIKPLFNDHFNKFTVGRPSNSGVPDLVPPLQNNRYQGDITIY